MKAEIGSRTGAEFQKLHYGWFEAYPYFDNNVYFYKLNKTLKEAGLDYRWWVVKHQEKRFIDAQGLWTPKEAYAFIKNIEWKKGRFIFPNLNYKSSQFMSNITYSCKIPTFVMGELCKRRVLEKREILEDGAYFSPVLNGFESAVSYLFFDRNYMVKTQLIPEEPEKIWFSLTTEANSV